MGPRTTKTRGTCQSCSSMATRPRCQSQGSPARCHLYVVGPPEDALPKAMSRRPATLSFRHHPSIPASPQSRSSASSRTCGSASWTRRWGFRTLGPLPAKASFTANVNQDCDLFLVFVRSHHELAAQLGAVRAHRSSNGVGHLAKEGIRRQVRRRRQRRAGDRPRGRLGRFQGLLSQRDLLRPRLQAEVSQPSPLTTVLLGTSLTTTKVFV